jgi:ketosteroid isomerase-like protein
MIRRFLRLVALFAVFGLGAAPAFATVAPSAAEAAPSAATATVDAFHAALKAGDTRAALDLLANDVLVFEEGVAERSKAEYAARHVAADAAFSSAVPATRTRRRSGGTGDFAWVATEGRVNGVFRGREVNRVTVETMVLRRVGATWKIVHIHWSSAAAS